MHCAQSPLHRAPLVRLTLLATPVLLWFAAAAARADDDTVLLPWGERRPYFYLDPASRPAGIFHALGERIFAQAGIATRWAEMPTNRLMRMLARNQQRLCLVGWFKTPEREALGRFSEPFFRTPPMRGVVPRDSALQGNISLTTLFAKPDLRVLLKENFTYGPQLDRMLAALPGERIERVAVDFDRLPMMIRSKRADITFMPPAMFDDALAANSSLAREIRLLPLTGLEDNLWYIICTLQVTEAVMQRLNRAIGSLGDVK